MEFIDYIEAGKKIAGNQKKLANAIGVKETSMSAMVKGKVPIPAHALAKLAMLIGQGVTPGEIWEAQQAARAETEEERQLWLPFMKNAHSLKHAASIFMAVAIAFLVSAYPTESRAATGFSINNKYSDCLLCQLGETISSPRHLKVL